MHPLTPTQYLRTQFPAPIGCKHNRDFRRVGLDFSAIRASKCPILQQAQEEGIKTRIGLVHLVYKKDSKSPLVRLGKRRPCWSLHPSRLAFEDSIYINFVEEIPLLIRRAAVVMACSAKMLGECFCK